MGFKPETKKYYLGGQDDILSFKENVRNNDTNLSIILEATIKNTSLDYNELDKIKNISSLHYLLKDYDINIDEIINREEIIDLKVLFEVTFSDKYGEQLVISLFDLTNDIRFKFIPNRPEHNLILPFNNNSSEIKRNFLLSLSCLPFINLKMDLKSDLYDFNNFINVIKNDSGIANKSEVITDTLLLYYKIYYGMPEIFRSKFLKLEHLEPIRKEPKSTYVLTGGKFDEKEYYGIPALLADDYVMMLYRDLDEQNENIEPTISTNMSEDKIIVDVALSFDYNFNGLLNKILNKLKLAREIKAHKDSENIAGWLTYTSLDGQNTSNLAQASSGLLQILPIITALLNKDKLENNSINIIEQPELHLHPKLQAELADFFFSKNISSNNLVIETHSEHIIRKVQVLVAQGEVKKEQIAVYYFNKDEKTGITSIKEMELEDNGFFKEPWPDGFFDDSYNLTKELLKANKN